MASIHCTEGTFFDVNKKASLASECVPAPRSSGAGVWDQMEGYTCQGLCQIFFAPNIVRTHFHQSNYVLPGARHTYHCREGFLFRDTNSSVKTVSCNSIGTNRAEWSQDMVDCEASCPAPETPHGYIRDVRNGDIFVGDIIRYVCDPGLYFDANLTTQKNLSCIGDTHGGYWLESDSETCKPFCRIQNDTTMQPPTDDIRVVAAGMSHVFQCIPGFMFDGSQSDSRASLCVSAEDGSTAAWKDPVPLCVESIPNDDHLDSFGGDHDPDPTSNDGPIHSFNGGNAPDARGCLIHNDTHLLRSEKSSIPAGNTHTFTCSPGYSVAGQSSPSVTLKCVDSPRKSHWNESVQRCVAMCVVQPLDQSEIADHPSIYIASGLSHTYTCREDFILKGFPVRSKTVICRSLNNGENANWSDVITGCEPEGEEYVVSGSSAGGFWDVNRILLVVLTCVLLLGFLILLLCVACRKCCHRTLSFKEFNDKHLAGMAEVTPNAGGHRNITDDFAGPFDRPPTP
eukprot:254151_1